MWRNFFIYNALRFYGRTPLAVVAGRKTNQRQPTFLIIPDKGDSEQARKLGLFRAIGIGLEWWNNGILE